MKVRRANDSSKTRVAPVFDALVGTSPEWPRRLLDLSAFPNHPKGWDSQDLKPTACFWHSTNPRRKEKALHPPLSLLKLLVLKATVPSTGMPKAKATTVERREKLCGRDPATVAEALAGLESGKVGKEWYVMEGPSYPDAFIETPDALIVVEGKVTEAGATTRTTWMSKRHQMLRHLDAAWEIRGRRSLYGLFIVEADPSTSSTAVPAKWATIAGMTTAEDALVGSLPHRNATERREIAQSLAGATSWQAIQGEFDLHHDLLKPRQ